MNQAGARVFTCRYCKGERAIGYAPICAALAVTYSDQASTIRCQPAPPSIDIDIGRRGRKWRR